MPVMVSHVKIFSKSSCGISKKRHTAVGKRTASCTSRRAFSFFCGPDSTETNRVMINRVQRNTAGNKSCEKWAKIDVFALIHARKRALCASTCSPSKLVFRVLEWKVAEGRVVRKRLRDNGMQSEISRCLSYRHEAFLKSTTSKELG